MEVEQNHGGSDETPVIAERAPIVNQGAKSVTRTVQFFRVYTEVRDDALVPFDNEALCRAISAVASGPDPYMEVGDGDVQICAYLDDPDHTDRFSLAKIRRHSRPLTEQGMVRETLALQPGKGLLDPIHVRLFPNNIIAAEYNDDGPRIARLRSLLREKLEAHYGTFAMQPIYDRKVIERLQNLDEVDLFHFKVDRAALDLRIVERNFWRGIIASSDRTAMPTIEIIMRVRERDDQAETAEIKDEINALLASPTGVLKVRVRGREGDGPKEEIDLLADRIVSRQAMMRIDADTSAIDPDSAYNAIGTAYENVRERIPEIDLVEPE